MPTILRTCLIHETPNARIIESLMNPMDMFQPRIRPSSMTGNDLVKIVDVGGVGCHICLL